MFLNRDPIEEAGGLNLYGFCSNDAVNGRDYLGFEDLSEEELQAVNAYAEDHAPVAGYGDVNGPTISWDIVYLSNEKIVKINYYENGDGGQSVLPDPIIIGIDTIRKYTQSKAAASGVSFTDWAAAAEDVAGTSGDTDDNSDRANVEIGPCSVVEYFTTADPNETALESLLDPNSGQATTPTTGDTSLMSIPGVTFERNYPYAKAYVKQNGNNVDIYVPVIYKGPTATAANIATFESGVTKYWTGTFGSYNTSVHFIQGGYTVTSGSTSFTFATGVYMADAGTARSWYAPSYGVMALNTANWSERTSAHEVGHLMGSPDGYVEGTWAARPGWENNIMGPSPNGKVEEINIQNAIDRWGGLRSKDFVLPSGP